MARPSRCMVEDRTLEELNSMLKKRSVNLPVLLNLIATLGRCLLPLAVLALASVVFAQSTPAGETIYQTRCAMCHATGIPPFMTRREMKAMAPEIIVNTLSNGAMREQGASMSPAERIAVAEFLTGKRMGGFPSEGVNACTRAPSQDFSGPQWNGWGVDLDNS